MNWNPTEILWALSEPVTRLVDPTRRVFVPFLVGSGVIAVALRLARGLPLTAALRGTVSSRVWTHPSALADYRLIIVRAMLKAALWGAWTVSSLAIAAVTMSWLRVRLGSPGLHASALTLGALFSLTAFVAEDFARFFAHFALHRVPALWAFHRVHHSAEVMTPFTLYRSHPVEGVINQAAGALTVGLVTGVFAWSFGPALRGWQLLGVDALGFVWSLAGANLRHSHVWLSYGARVERWLLSPAQHQIHHSADARHVDKNFGVVFAVWDRLFGSLYVPAGHEPLRFGLPPGEPPMRHTVRSMLLNPFAVLAAQARRSSALVRATALGAALLSVSCSNERFDRVSLLQGMTRCTTQLNDQFQTAASSLATATASYAAAPGEANRAAARAAWEGAIDVWQRAEMHRYGPAAGFDSPAGQNLRTEIYAWPDVNRCLIEQRIASRGYEGAALAQLPSSARGLAAIEYLLFAPGTDNACAPTDPINATGAWAALGAEEITRRRAAYASAAAADVLTRANALRAAWAPSGFEAQLVTAGQGSRAFRTQQEAFNAVADAVFRVETDTRNLRVGRPAGVMSCATGTCPEALESQWANRSLSHVRNNIVGLRMLLEGCAAGDNQGFDDRLDAAGAGALSARMRSLLAAVDSAISAVPGGDLRAALSGDRASVQRLYDAIQALTAFLKMEFTATLQITGSRLEGDND